MLVATEYQILRGVVAGGPPLLVGREPIRVATLINEARFIEQGSALLHRVTVFLEDQHHDWTWRDGKFRYFSRVAAKADVVLVYAEMETRFCAMCGKQVYPEFLCECSDRCAPDADK